MITTETEKGPNPEGQTKEWIDKAVIDAFNELFAEISAKKKLHPTEQVNKDDIMAEHPSTKIYDFINSYHSYCKLCEQHFYSRSVANDINSFFQNHLNTSYHRQMRSVFPPPDDTPIFTWEEKFLSGRCNLCEMSGLNSYILDTAFDSRRLIKTHFCFWDFESRETNERVLRKLHLLKKYCGLKIFREKFLKTVNGRGVCLLCMIKLPWSVEKAECHLASDSHYQNFCGFIRSRFNFLLKDALNGYNLEVITRWLISHDPPPVSEFADFDERKMCLQRSNSEENPYPEEQDNFSFSPKHLENFLTNEETDFIHNNECLLCNVALKPGHMDSEPHRSKVEVLDKALFATPEKYLIFSQNREKRLRIIENYKTLKSGLQDPCLLCSPNNDIKRSSQTSSKENYFKTFFKKKIDLVNSTFTVPRSGEVFCEVCDQHISSAHEITHLTSFYHKSQEEKWNELKVHFANEKFTETFLKVRNIILCLVCGAFFDPNTCFSHLKGGMHLQRFEWYCNLKNTIPISSAFSFKKDFSCFCTLCNTPMNRRMSFSSLKTTLSNIKCHWPCPKNKTDNKTDLSNEKKIISEPNETEVEKNQNPTQEILVPCSTCKEPFKESEMKTHSVTCAKNSVDFKKVGQTVKRVLNIFEKKIMYGVLDRSTTVLCRVHNLKLPATKKDIKKSLNKAAGALSCCNQSSTCLCTLPRTAENEKEEPPEQECLKTLKKELSGQKTDNNIQNVKVKSVKDREKENLEKEEEVLLIEGLPKSKRRYEVIYTKCNSFAKVRYVFFCKKTAILAFADRSASEVVAEAQALFNESGISVSVSTRKENVKANVETLPPLNKDLIPLLQDPQKIMELSLNLVLQAIRASESPLERKREELVCGTIISAVLEQYPHGRCYPFGSRLSGLTLSNSDLDVFLDCGGMYEGFKNTTPSSERKIVNKVAGLLRKKREITEITVVDRARVPIVSFLHRPTLMRCDLSFKNGLSVQNTLLIKFMVSLDWRVRPLILFLKFWAKFNGLHGPPYFSSYAIAMLVIYYLEQLECPVLPTIESLQNSYVGRRMTIGGWDCSVNLNQSVLPVSENKETFPKLLADLFEFYAKFDYQMNIISPLTGKPLPRETFSSLGFEKLPMCYKRHILNIPAPIETLVNKKIYICIVDPFDISHILTKGFTPRGLQMFTHFCKASAELLKKAITVADLGQNN